jgi:hypothetical protein
VGKHFFLKSHSTLCGLLIFNFTLTMQILGLGVVNQFYDVPEMAYLYNIIQQTGRKGVTWPDMDAFIAMHGEDQIFIGGRPKTAEDSKKKLLLATGIASPSDFARGARNRGQALSNNSKSRLMEPSAAVVNIFQDRYINNGTNKLSVDHVDRLLAEIAPRKGLDVNKQTADIGGVDLLRKRFEKTHRLGALQLLAAIKQGLYAEEPFLNFNYFGMHKRCIEIFRLIQKKEHHKFVQYFSERYMPNDTLIANLVILIMEVAAGSSKATQHLGISLGSGASTASRMVVSCEEVLEVYLRSNGDKACKEIQAFCKNKYLGEDTGLQVQAKENAYWFCFEELMSPARMATANTGENR